jgi:hypothetical protein
MTTPSTTDQQDTSLTRDLIYAARYYLGRPRVLVTLAIVAVVAGIALNWTWLVAVGLAPILLTTLPCLIMCAFGVCMMCRSAKEPSAPGRDVAEAPPPATLTTAAIDNPGADANSTLPAEVEATAPVPLAEPPISDPSVSVSRCSQSPMREAKPPQTNELEPSEEGKVPNA